MATFPVAARSLFKFSSKSTLSTIRRITSPSLAPPTRPNEINFKLKGKPYKYHLLEENTLANTFVVTRDQALKYYKQMSLIRRLEKVSSLLYKEKVIRGFCHLYTGQEACGVGFNDVIETNDSVITAYRCHGWAYLRGQSPTAVLAELTGRISGCSKGKGGSMHMYAPDFYGGNGIVGAQVPVGAGIALAHKLKGSKQISVTVFGDGAANQGQVFEAFNMAALWTLPCIFVVENNGYGMGTSTTRASHVNQFFTRGDYIPGIQVDGNCVISVREAARFAVEWVTGGKGPLVLELCTYRFFGHSMSDPGTSYRSRDEIQEIRQKRDPITSFRERILTEGLVEPRDLRLVDEDVKREMSIAEDAARNDPFPPDSDMGLFIYSEGTGGKKVRGCDLFTLYNTNDKV